MQVLTDKQRRFVLAYVQQNGKNGSQAARLAGYSKGEHGADALRAFELLRHPKVTRAIQEEAGRRLSTLALAAVMTLEQNMGRGNAKARQNAADSILDRTGFPRRMERDVQVSDNRPQRSHLELVAAVADKLKSLSIKVPELLPAPIDAEYKSVSKQEGKQDAVAQTDAVVGDEDER
jgi:hypothetical protein